MGLVDFVHTVATGPVRRRERLAPFGLLVFGLSLVIVVGGGIGTDGLLNLPPLLPGALGTVLGCCFLVAGACVCTWCIARFFQARGTPVPLHPPAERIVSGLYAYVRNPMLSGVFAMVFGVGFIWHSIGIVVVWAPAYVILHTLELKLVEEPELVRRFGSAYEAYRSRVPMFVPSARRYRVD